LALFFTTLRVGLLPLLIVGLVDFLGQRVPAYGCKKIIAILFALVCVALHFEPCLQVPIISLVSSLPPPLRGHFFPLELLMENPPDTAFSNPSLPIPLHR